MPVPKNIDHLSTGEKIVRLLSEIIVRYASQGLNLDGEHIKGNLFVCPDGKIGIPDKKENSNFSAGHALNGALLKLISYQNAVLNGDRSAYPIDRMLKTGAETLGWIARFSQIDITTPGSSDEHLHEQRKPPVWVNDAGDFVVLDPHGLDPTTQHWIENINYLRNRLLSEPKGSDNTGDFTHSEDYRSVSIGGKTFCLTTQRARIIEKLHLQYQLRLPEISVESLIENRSSRLIDSFKNDKEAYHALIVKGARKGTVRLNLPLARPPANTT